MSPKPLLAAIALALLPVAPGASAQPSLWDLVTPDRFLRSVVQTSIMTLRTQMDLQYGDLQVDMLSGRLNITDVSVWPLPDWDVKGDCVVTADRVTLRTVAVDEPDRLRLRLRAQGASADAICFPDEPRQGLVMAGLERVQLDRLTMDIDYDLRSSGAVVHLHGDIADLAAAELRMDFAYVWFDGREDMDDAQPVAFLERATLVIEDRGLWPILQAVLPPQFTDPEGAPVMLQAMLAGALADANRSAAKETDPAPGALSVGQTAFLASVSETAPAFLADPRRIVLETRIDGDVHLDFPAMEDDPRVVFDTLRPVAVLAPASLREALPADLLRRALGDGADSLTADERRRVGMALTTGDGAPRNVAAGMALLEGLAAGGDGAAALAMSAALEDRDAAAAYLWALRAGTADQDGATARLDRIEARIGLAAALDLQNRITPPGPPGRDALTDLRAIRTAATRHLAGRGAARSYHMAAVYALIGAGAGDGESADVLGDLAAMARLAPEPDRAVWTRQEEIAGQAAMEAWIALDLPARLAR